MNYQEQEVARDSWQGNLRRALRLAIFNHKLERNQGNIKLDKLSLPKDEASLVFFSELNRIGIEAIPRARFCIDFRDPPSNMSEEEKAKWIYSGEVKGYYAKIGGMDGVIVEVTSGENILGYSIFWQKFDSSSFFDMTYAKGIARRSL